MQKKGFLFCKGTSTNDYLVRDYRLFAEKCFGESKCDIIRFTLKRFDEKQKERSISYRYLPDRYRVYDDMKAEQCPLAMFYSTQRTSKTQDLEFHLVISHRTPENFTVRATWTIKEFSIDGYIGFVRAIRKELEGFLEIMYLFSGTIDMDKDVELLMQGVSTDHRNLHENAIARNIQKANYFDNRLPYLFPYTYCANMPETWAIGCDERKTVLINSLITCPIDEYHFNSTWSRYYELLRENKSVIPLVNR